MPSSDSEERHSAHQFHLFFSFWAHLTSQSFRFVGPGSGVAKTRAHIFELLVMTDRVRCMLITRMRNLS